MKSKVISFRVSEDVLNVIELICKDDGISRNKLLSDLVCNNFNIKIQGNKLTDLEKILLKLKCIVLETYNPYTDTLMPCIYTGTEEDGEYEGKLQILVGDDSLIREKNGKYYRFSFHNENAEPIWMDEQEVLDFYAGQNLAYEFPLWKDHSYHFIRGFVDVAESLLSSLQENLETNKK